ncbi:MAG: hypothetical protein K5981_07630 [Clostridia bacterium]|nr:hypothetical protein [Clostridia bacterium]
MKRNALFILLFLMLSLGFGLTHPASVFAEGAVGGQSLDEFEYTVDEEAAAVTLTKYVGTAASVEVAGSYELEGVTYRTIIDTQTIFRGN